MQPVRFAISYTVRNESRILPSAIRYHLAAGCSRIYLYWDGTSDGSEQLVTGYPEVIARNSIHPSEIEDPPEWLAKILTCWEIDMDVRKIANTYHAARDAAIEGIDWLGSIDPDELILMGRNEEIEGDHILKHLRRVGDDIDQLLLLNLESVPSSAESKCPFSDCVHFLNRLPATEFLWRYSRAALIRISRSPKLIAWYDYFFYQVRLLGALPRLMREPNSGSVIPAGYFLGYSSYKSMIRTKSFTNFNFATHFWKRYLRAPRTLRLGNVLHFDMLDATYFSAKFRQRMFGERDSIFYLRYRLGLIARNYSESEIREFFQAYIAINDPARIAMLKKKGILLEIDAVSKLMKKVSKEPC
jgi:hypothetical protein